VESRAPRFVRWARVPLLKPIDSFVPIETLIYFVSWLALAILGAGLLLRGWKWLLVSGWGWLLAMVISFVFWLGLAICGAGLLILGRWWLALAIFGGGLLILWWKEYVEPRSGLPTSDARDC
jgi:hypothetical protein